MKRAKLIEKARRNQAGIRFAELCKIAESFGFRFDRQSGSHAFYVNAAIRVTMNFQDHAGKAKPYQVRQLLDAIDRHGLTLRD